MITIYPLMDSEYASVWGHCCSISRSLADGRDAQSRVSVTERRPTPYYSTRYSTSFRTNTEDTFTSRHRRISM